MSIPSSFLRLLSDRGISMMEKFGTADVALTADDALAAVDALLGARVAVLGGDVFFNTVEGLKLAHANWHTDPSAGEDLSAYVARSIQAACDYIRAYPVVPDKTALFVLVVAEVN